MQRHARPHSAAIAFAALLLALSSLAPMTNLCVGSGGHLAIEAALAGCSGPGNSHDVTGQILAEGGRCADQCTDSPVGIYTAGRIPEHATPPLPVLASSVHVLSPVPMTTLLLSRPAAWPRISVPSRALRTTVNLC